MGIYIPTMAADHWLKVLVCVLTLLNTNVNGQPPVPPEEMVKLTLLGNAVEKGAVCLDGSPAGYHFYEGSGEGADSWMIYLPGGGWCGSVGSCSWRIKNAPEISTTNNISDVRFEGMLSPHQTINPDFYNWNKVFIRYCDGSSFIGDVEAVDPETNIHLRGSRIFTAVVNELLTKGLQNAKNVILTGNSAGGLATILNCDRFRALVPNANRLKCIADSGFFIRAKHLPYVERREDIYNRTVHYHGIAQFLPKSCTSKREPGLCFFPEYLVGHVKTPLFLLNSDFDRFQVSENLRPYPADMIGWTNCTNSLDTCTPPQSQIIKDFGSTFLRTVKKLRPNPSRGLFINSCYIHDFLYSTARFNTPYSPRLENKTIAKAIADWYFDRSSVRLVDTQTDHPVDCRID